MKKAMQFKEEYRFSYKSLQIPKAILQFSQYYGVILLNP